MLVAICAMLPAPARAEEDASKASLRVAEVRLDALEKRARHRSTRRRAFDPLEAAAYAVDAIVPPPKPEMLPIDPDAGATVTAAAARENRRRLARWMRAKRAYDKRRERSLQRWVRLLETFLTLDARQVPDPLGFTPGIQHRALELLARTGRADAADAVMRGIEVWIRSDQFWFGVPFLPRAFEVLPRFRSPKVLHWLCTAFVGREDHRPGSTRVCTSVVGGGVVDEYVVDVPLFALQAVGCHDALPGRYRRRAMRRLVDVYAPMEERAQHVRAKARLWERLGAAAIDAAWRLAGKPTDELDVPPTTMAELAAWLDAHDSPDDPAWQD